jgi:anion-transporting  ArsA/GET3 family ATPase
MSDTSKYNNFDASKVPATVIPSEFQDFKRKFINAFYTEGSEDYGLYLTKVYDSIISKLNVLKERVFQVMDKMTCPDLNKCIYYLSSYPLSFDSFTIYTQYHPERLEKDWEDKLQELDKKIKSLEEILLKYE